MKTALNWMWFFRIAFQLLALFIAVVLIWFLANLTEIRETIGFFPLLGIPALASLGLYVFRSWCRFSYGFAEVLFGLIAVWFSIDSDVVAEGAHSIDALKMGASIYIVIRGLDNMQKGLKGTTAEDWLYRRLPA